MIMQIIQQIKELGIPIRYRVFRSKPSVPFLVYYRDTSDNFSADGIAYTKFNNYVLELYAEKPEKDIEAAIENILDENGTYWETEETYIESEKLILTYYYFQVKGEK